MTLETNVGREIKGVSGGVHTHVTAKPVIDARKINAEVSVLAREFQVCRYFLLLLK